MPEVSCKLQATLEDDMGSTAIVQATVDTTLRDQASAVLAELGMTVEDALRLLLTQVVEQHDLPRSMHIPNEQTIAAMREADSGVGKRYASLEELFRDMRS
jgi:DNA-damage-inducible protein J